MLQFAEMVRWAICRLSVLALLGLFLALLCVWACRVVRRVYRSGDWRHWVLPIPLIAVAIIYGGSKPHISFPYTDPTQRYFTDAGSEVRDNSIWLTFTAMRIPMSADFHGCYRRLVDEGENTNEWIEFLTGTVSQYLDPIEIPFAEAKKYEFMFFSTYVEGPTVHTNGVLNVKWGVPQTAVTDSVRAVPIQTEVRLDGNAAATPDHGIDIEPQTDSLLNRLMEETDEQ